MKMHSQNKMAEKTSPGKGPVRPHHLLGKEEMRVPSKEQEASDKGQEASAKGQAAEASGKGREASARRKTVNPRPADPNRHGFPSGFSLPKKKLIPFGQEDVPTLKRVAATPADTLEHAVPTPAVTLDPEHDVSTPTSTPDQDA